MKHIRSLFCLISDDENIQIDFVQILPMELIEEIFQYLTPKDLAAVTAVSSSWREAVNSNKLWGRLCDLNGWKDDFDPNFSHFCKSHQQFRKWEHSYDTFSAICQKRLLFNKHSCLLKNWRCGKFVVHKIVTNWCSELREHQSLYMFEPVTCDGHYIVIAEYSKSSTAVAVWSLNGVPFRLCDLYLPNPVKPVDALTFDHNTIVFIQDWIIVVYKLFQYKFELAYLIEDLKPLAPVGRLSNSMKQLTPFLKVTQDTIVCVPSHSHSTVDFIPIFFWDRETGEVKHKLDFDSMYYQITSAIWLGESCYLAMSNKKIKSYQVVEFGVKTGTWEYFSQRVTGAIELITGNDKYILAVTKVSPSREDDFFFLSRSENKELCLWDRATGSSLKKFKVSGRGFQFVDDYLMFFESSLLTVMNPRDPNIIRSEFEVTGTISSIKACQHPSVLVVIKTGCNIEVWDWGVGSRLYTVTAETGYGSKIWCDNQRIITYHSERDQGYGILALGFW